MDKWSRTSQNQAIKRFFPSVTIFKVLQTNLYCPWICSWKRVRWDHVWIYSQCCFRHKRLALEKSKGERKNWFDFPQSQGIHTSRFNNAIIEWNCLEGHDPFWPLIWTRYAWNRETWIVMWEPWHFPWLEGKNNHSSNAKSILMWLKVEKWILEPSLRCGKMWFQLSSPSHDFSELF